jgi:hypothetical protein
MAVKIFLGSIIFLAFVSISGLAVWFWPVLNEFHVAMGGKPLTDPRGDMGVELSQIISFLPDNNLARALIIAGIVLGYFFITVTATLIAMRFRQRGRDKAEREKSRRRAVNVYEAKG